jgi:excisionase family DNA binding protein
MAVKKQKTTPTTTTAAITAPALQPRCLDVKASAQYLGCAVWAIRELIWQRKLRAIKFGKKQLVDRTDLDAFIERQKAGVR